MPTENCTIQTLLSELTQYTEDHQMRLNNDKTRAILFNNAIKYDVQPNLTIQNGDQLQVVDEIRLFGVQVRWYVPDSILKIKDVEEVKTSGSF